MGWEALPSNRPGLEAPEQERYRSLVAVANEEQVRISGRLAMHQRICSSSVSEQRLVVDREEGAVVACLAPT